MTVLIGVKDAGQITGQIINDKTKREIAHEVKQIEPSASIDVDYIKVKVKDNTVVIAIQVNRGHHVPYTYDGRAFERRETETHRISQHRYEQLLVERGELNHSWEDITATSYSVDSLNFANSIGGSRSIEKFALTTRQHEILKLLENSPLNGTKITEMLKDQASIRAVQKDLAKLEMSGLVIRTGKARSVMWSIVK